jgi:hypothetical protein
MREGETTVTPTRTHLARLAALLAALAVAPAAGCDTTYVFDEVGVGEGDEGRTPRARSNSQFLRAVYADLIGRNPERYDFVVSVGGEEAARFPLSEQEILVAVMDGVGDPTPMRNLVVAGLVWSAEVDLPEKAEVDDPRAFIVAQFRTFLGRDPGVYELRALLDEWDADPAVDPRTVIRAILASREYQSF